MLSLHPIHLIPDKKGQLPPSALVPFCSYQGESNMLGQKRPELDNLTICDKFEPTILEGQLCYSIDIARIEKRQTEAGKTKGLFLLLDPTPYQMQDDERGVETEGNKPQTFKVYIHTLAPFTVYGHGAFAMSTLKSMTGTESFEELPNNQKKCAVHNREECQTEKLFSQIKANCSCVPWSLTMNDDGIAQVSLFLGLSHPI